VQRDIGAVKIDLPCETLPSACLKCRQLTCFCSLHRPRFHSRYDRTALVPVNAARY